MPATAIRPITESAKVPEPSPKGRVCSTDGCGTILSIWNSSTRCSVHRPLLKSDAWTKREKNAIGEALREIMEESS